MKTILFDLWTAQPSNGSKFHGGGEYIKSVFNHLLMNYFSEIKISVFFDFSLFLDNWILKLIENHGIEKHDIRNNKDLQTLLTNEKPNIFFSGLPYLYGNLQIPPQTFFVGTIHGLRTIEIPSDKFAYKYFKASRSIKEWVKSHFKSYFRKKRIHDFEICLKNLDSIVCVSNHTKYAIKTFFHQLSKQVNCFYTPQKVNSCNIIEHTDVASKFILLIATNRFEKNSYRAVRALNNLFEKGFLTNYKVVTTGNIPQSVEKSITHKSKFIHLGYVSPEKLEGLYADCDFFLYPTLNEGFGMPPLEAMKYGKTCIVSGVCSVPEVCGEAVYYINPYDISEMENRILMAEENKISPEKIKAHLATIIKSQERDLDNLFHFICSCSKKDIQK